MNQLGGHMRKALNFWCGWKIADEVLGFSSWDTILFEKNWSIVDIQYYMSYRLQYNDSQIFKFILHL